MKKSSTLVYADDLKELREKYPELKNDALRLKALLGRLTITELPRPDETAKRIPAIDLKVTK